MHKTIIQAIIAHAKNKPNRLALGFRQMRLTYAELCAQIAGCATLLNRCYAVQAQDRVMLSAVAKPEYIVAYFAIQYFGAVVVPIDKGAKEEEIAQLYDYIQPKLLLTDTTLHSNRINKISLKSLYEQVLGDDDLLAIAYTTPNEDQVAEMIFTTGTTGKPKAVMLTYQNILANTQNTKHGINMLPSDCVLIPLPLFHSLALRQMRTAFFVGATVVLQNGCLFAKDLEDNILQYHCTGLVMVPALFELVYRQMRECFTQIIGKLRYIEIGGGSLGINTKKKLPQLLPNTLVYNTWGSTETGGVFFFNLSAFPNRLTTIGKPIAGVKIKIIGAGGEEVCARSINTAGRMALKGKMQMVGYYCRPQLTQQTLIDGWLLTNDLVYQDEIGDVYMLGRADDIINVGGEKVFLPEIENAAQEYEAICECACIGVDDPQEILGQVPILYVVPQDSFDERKLVKYLATKLDKFKLPYKYICIDALPRNRLNKLDRNELCRRWQQSNEQDFVNEIICNIKSRRSIRRFKERPIADKLLNTIVNTGIYAPNGHNMQTWRFVVLQKQSMIVKLKETIQRVSEHKGLLFYGFNNPAAVVLISNDRRNVNGIQDSSCAAQNIMLAAHSFGVGSTWVNTLMTICDEPAIRALLDEYKLPQTHIVWALLVLGYPAEEGLQLAKNENVILFE